MAYLKTVATVPPPHRIEAEAVRAQAEAFAARWEMRPEVLLRVFDNSRVLTRHSVLSVQEAVQPRTFKERNDLFIEHSISLGSEAVRRCLAQAGRNPEDIDLLITVSCTGVMIPSVDAFIIEGLGLRRDCKRLPITELGCAAGAVGLARAYDYIKGFPDSKVLVLAIELPSLTFQPKDANMAHVVSAIIFGDGVACALVEGKTEGPAMKLLATRSHLFPKSFHYMGFDIDGEGFHIVLDKQVPYAVRKIIGEMAGGFLGEQGMSLKDIRFHAMHPAGKKVLHFIEEELGIDPAMTRSTWNTLRDHGNMSSASILYVLKELMEHQTPAPGDYGMLVAFGPGFSAELLLGRWEA